MSRKRPSEAMAALHETIQALHDVGAIDKQTLRHLDGASSRVGKIGARRRSASPRIAEAVVAGGEEGTRHGRVILLAYPRPL